MCLTMEFCSSLKRHNFTAYDNFATEKLFTKIMTFQLVKYYLAVYRHKAAPMRMITTHVLPSQFKTKEELDAKTSWYFTLFLPIHHFFTPFSPQM